MPGLTDLERRCVLPFYLRMMGLNALSHVVPFDTWGTLTAPPLATVALHGLGAKAVPSLEVYLRRDLEHQLGSASFTAAVLERLGAVPADVPISDQDRRAVDGMLMVVRRLAAAEPGFPAGAVG